MTPDRFRDMTDYKEYLERLREFFMPEVEKWDRGPSHFDPDIEGWVSDEGLDFGAIAARLIDEHRDEVIVAFGSLLWLYAFESLHPHDARRNLIDKATEAAVLESTVT